MANNSSNQPDPETGKMTTESSTFPYVSLVLMLLMVALCLVSLVISVAMPLPAGMKILPLLFAFIAATAFVISRIWVAKERLLACQILVGAFFVGLTSAMLVMLVCFYFVASSNVK